MDYNYWIQHFEENQSHMNDIPMDTYEEEFRSSLRPFIGSIRQMQRGEHSEGHNLMRMAKAYARHSGEKTYARIIELFIREEQRHAAILGKFLDIYKIPKLRGHWVDTVFRKLRRFFSLEYAISTLLVAETIALVYYACLEKATQSKMLKSICIQILKDEHAHVLFQFEAMHMFRSKSHALSRALYSAYTNVLMFGTLWVVWVYHRNVLKMGGLGPFSFFRKVWTTLNEYRQISHSDLKISTKSLRHASV